MSWENIWLLLVRIKMGLWNQFKGKKNTPQVLRQKADKLGSYIFDFSFHATRTFMDEIKNAGIPLDTSSELQICQELIILLRVCSLIVASLLLDALDDPDKPRAVLFHESLVEKLLEKWEPVLKILNDSLPEVKMTYFVNSTLQEKRSKLYLNMWQSTLPEIDDKFEGAMVSGFGSEVARLLNHPKDRLLANLATKWARTVIEGLDLRELLTDG